MIKPGPAIPMGNLQDKALPNVGFKESRQSSASDHPNIKAENESPRSRIVFRNLSFDVKPSKKAPDSGMKRLVDDVSATITQGEVR